MYPSSTGPLTMRRAANKIDPLDDKSVVGERIDVPTQRSMDTPHRRIALLDCSVALGGDAVDHVGNHRLNQLIAIVEGVAEGPRRLHGAHRDHRSDPRPADRPMRTPRRLGRRQSAPGTTTPGAAHSATPHAPPHAAPRARSARRVQPTGCGGLPDVAACRARTAARWILTASACAISVADGSAAVVHDPQRRDRDSVAATVCATRGR